MAVTDDEFGALAARVEGLSVRVRALEDDRTIDRAEAQVRHRAVVDGLQALRLTQVELSNDLSRQGRDLEQLRTDVERGFAATELRFDVVQDTLAHVVRLLGRPEPPDEA